MWAVLLRHAGEGARTLQDAKRYLQSYQHAIDVIGATAAGVRYEVSISIKLSALELAMAAAA